MSNVRELTIDNNIRSTPATNGFYSISRPLRFTARKKTPFYIVRYLLI